MPKGFSGDMVRGLPESVLKSPDVQRALQAWPPKLAAKTLSKDEREAEDKAASSAEERAMVQSKLDAALLKKKAAKRASIAAGLTKPAVTSEKASAVEMSKPTERVARSTGAKE